MDEFRGAGVEEAIAAATRDHRLPVLAESKARGHVERDKERHLARCRPLIEELRRTRGELQEVQDQARGLGRRLRQLARVVRNMQRKNPSISSETASLIGDVIGAVGILAAFRTGATIAMASAAAKLGTAIGLVGVMLVGSRFLVDSTRADLPGLRQQLLEGSREVQILRGRHAVLLARYRSDFSKLQRECRDAPGYPWGIFPI